VRPGGFATAPMTSTVSRPGTDRTGPLLVVLTVAAAATDAISYLGLGHVFPANMTGNTALLGLGLATGDPAGASRSATALAAFALAALLAGAARPQEGWSRGVLVTLSVELALLGGALAWWLTLPAHPEDGPRYGLIALVGAAMGTQSAAIRGAGVTGVTTTYITGTWTALSSAIGARLRGGEAHRLTRSPLRRQAAVVLGYPISAFATAATFRYWHAGAMLIPVSSLALVIVLLGRSRWTGRPGE
jgi:uncharacterized membrane protein YoaK (UPF0700 family)